MVETSLKKRLRKRFLRIKGEVISYEGMSLKNKLNTLSALQRQRKELSTELEDLDCKILVLKIMPNVTERLLSKDFIAISLIEKLRENGEMSCLELENLPGERYSGVILAYAVRLSRAKLVEMIPNPLSPQGDYILKLTERGRSLKYNIKK